MKQSSYEKALNALERYLSEHRKDGVYLSFSSAHEFAENYHQAINALFEDFQVAKNAPDDLNAIKNMGHWYQTIRSGDGPASHLVAFLTKLVEKKGDSAAQYLYLDSAKKVSVLLKDALDRNDAALASELTFWLAAQTFAALEEHYVDIALDIGEIAGVGHLTRSNRTGRRNKSRVAIVCGLQALAREQGKVPTENELIKMLRKHSTESTAFQTNAPACPQIWMEEGRLYYEWADSPEKPTNTGSIALSTYRTEIKKLIEL